LLYDVYNERNDFQKNFWQLRPEAQKWVDSRNVLGNYDNREAAINGMLWKYRQQPIDTASTDNKPVASAGPENATTTTPNAKPDKPAFTKSGSTINPPASGDQPAPDKPASSGASVTSDAHTTPVATSDQQTTLKDTGAPPSYLVIVAKIIRSTGQGKLGDPEPEAEISFNTPAYPLRNKDEKGAGPQDGHAAGRAICITLKNGTCEVTITIDELPYYGLDRIKVPRIDLTFETEGYQGGFNVVSKDNLPKIDPKKGGGNTIDIPYEYPIGSMTVLRHTFRTPYDGSDGFPKNILIKIDPCLFILPAPWGAELNTSRPAGSDLPAATIELTSPGQGGAQ
jgi:hypothetical protein